MAYIDIVRVVRDGEPVNAGTVNRPLQELEGNIRYLKDLFEAATLGQAVFARGQVVEADAQVGQAVYYNATTQRFERALGGVEIDASGDLRPTAASQVWGVVYAKLSATAADLLVAGMAPVDLSAAVAGTVLAGQVYYLSNTAPGMLEAQLPPMGAAVLQAGAVQADGTCLVHVRTQFFDPLTAHRHYNYDLVCEQSGSALEEGWLPASHAVFDGRAPAGARYGYNLSVSPLAQLWPPLPTEGAYLEWQRGHTTTQLGEGVPMGEGGLCLIDRNGLWWLSDCEGDEPWDNVVVSVSECPFDLPMSMRLWFSKPVFQSTGTAVLSLRTAADSGLSLTCTDSGEPADRGHLTLDLDLGLTTAGDTDAEGYTVMKSLEGNTLHRGPVVESLTAGSANVHLAAELDTDGRYQGNVTLTVDTGVDGSELGIDEVRLDGATEEWYQNTMAIGFPASQDAEYRGRLAIPANAVIAAGTKLKLRFWLLSRSDTALPSAILSVSYRRLSRPSGTTPVTLPTSDTALADIPDTTVTFTTTNQYVELETAEFEIASGDVVFFTVARTGSSDGYPGDLHLLRQRGVLVAE